MYICIWKNGDHADEKNGRIDKKYYGDTAYQKVTYLLKIYVTTYIYSILKLVFHMKYNNNAM